MAQGARTTSLLIAMALAVVAANLFKPVHMDDTAYLAMARAVLHDPWHPMRQPFNWVQVTEPLAAINQPLLVPWLLAGVMRIAGESQPALHLAISLCAVVALLVFHRMARRLAPDHALWLTGLLALGPGVLPAQNLMVDLPLLALLLLFFEPLLRPGPAGRTHAVYAQAAAALSAALLTKYNALALLPVLALLIAARRQWLALGWLLLPLGTLAAWTWFNLQDFGGAHLFGRAVPPLQPLVLIYRVLIWAGLLGALVPGAFAFLPAGNARAWRAPAAFGACVALLAHLMGNTPVRCAIWGMISANGTLLLVIAEQTVARLRRAWTSASDIPPNAPPAAAATSREVIVLLLAWIAATALFSILLAPFLALRHVLLALPAVLLLLGVGLRGAPQPIGLRRRAAAVALTALLGGWIALADGAFAGVYRDAPSAIRASLPPNARVYQVGHWGWQWYAHQAGLPEYDPGRTRLMTGDLLITPEWITCQKPIAIDAARLQLVKRVTIPATPLTWLRTSGWNPYGGLYATTGWHQAPPIFFDAGPVASFRIDQVMLPGFARPQN